MKNQLDILRHVDFDWVVRLDDVWSDELADAADLQRAIRDDFDNRLRQLAARTDTGSPLGYVIIGTGGSGKTHLLNAFRRKAVNRRLAFVLVDMTDVRDFWDTVLQGYIDSLQMPYRDNEFQYRCLLHDFLDGLPHRQQTARIMSVLAQRKSRQLAEDMNMLLKALAKEQRKETLKYQDVVRAVVCLNSDDFGISNLGMTWLQGQEIDAEDQRMLHFHRAQQAASFIVEALSWLMSLAGPTVLAFDQLDPLVQQLKYRSHADAGAEIDEDQSRSLSILLEVAGGLMALIDMTRKTQVVLSCIESTWSKLSELTMSPVAARYEPPLRLDTSATAEALCLLVGERMARACSKFGFEPPYATWPYGQEILESWIDDTPREVLQKCDRHRRACLKASRVYELEPATASAESATDAASLPNTWQHLDQRYEQLRQQADPAFLLEERFEEERIAPILCSGVRSFLIENPTLDDVDTVLEVQFPGGRKSVPLHCRVRYVFHAQDGREEHYCVRALQHTHHRAYQARLNAAMTVSGIDRALPYRHLIIVRRGPIPNGAATEKLTRKFTAAGGRFLTPSDDDLRSMFALDILHRDADDRLSDWLATRKPASRLDVIKAMLFRSDVEPETPVEPPTVKQGSESPPPEALPATEISGRHVPVVGGPDGDVDRSADTTGSDAAANDARGRSVADALAVGSATQGKVTVPLGNQLVGGQPREVVTLPAASLEKHCVVLAGAGSGKTVWLRRLVEETALCGIPSIVIDCANDLATFDMPWPEPPTSWLADDPRRAAAFQQQCEMVLWTPGRSDGNPLTLQPIPDLAAVSDNPQELAASVDMVSQSLREVVAAGNSARAKNKHGILVTSLRYFARLGGGGLDQYIDVLADLPFDAGPGVHGEQKLAQEMADRLRVEKETNPLLRSAGTDLDPAVLFGDDRHGQRTRISVINLVGLPGIEQQRHFLNQLAMLLFSWIKRNPKPPGRDLRGLLVIDEARDFVPSQKTSSCKDSLMQLAAQARKYHLGIVFATQNPKDIDSKIVGNCSTHVYGKANSPASIDVIKEQIRLKGGSGDDISRLRPGQFYVHNADLGLPAPVKVAVPMCLTHHPHHPLDETEILCKAAAIRKRLQR